MEFDRLEYDKVWTRSDEETGFPTYESSEELVREAMQYHPDVVKNFINALLTTLETVGGGYIAAEAGNDDGAKEKGTLNEVLYALYRRMDGLKNDISNAVLGKVPEAIRSEAVDFEVMDWTGMVTVDSITGEQTAWAQYTIPCEIHKRTRAAFGYLIRAGAESRSDTWASHCTEVAFDTSTYEITLKSEEPFDGTIIVFGV